MFFCVSYNIKAQKTMSSVDSFINKKRAYNKIAKKGYCIQIFNGSEEEAKTIYRDFQKNYDNIKIFMTYELPDWKIQTSSFYHKIKAEKTLKEIKKKYKSARLL